MGVLWNLYNNFKRVEKEKNLKKITLRYIKFEELTKSMSNSNKTCSMPKEL